MWKKTVQKQSMQRWGFFILVLHVLQVPASRSAWRGFYRRVSYHTIPLNSARVQLAPLSAVVPVPTINQQGFTFVARQFLPELQTFELILAQGLPGFDFDRATPPPFSGKCRNHSQSASG